MLKLVSSETGNFLVLKMSTTSWRRKRRLIAWLQAFLIPILGWLPYRLKTVSSLNVRTLLNLWKYMISLPHPPTSHISLSLSPLSSPSFPRLKMAFTKFLWAGFSHCHTYASIYLWLTMMSRYLLWAQSTWNCMKYDWVPLKWGTDDLLCDKTVMNWKCSSF